MCMPWPAPRTCFSSAVALHATVMPRFAAEAKRHAGILGLSRVSWRLACSRHCPLGGSAAAPWLNAASSGHVGANWLQRAWWALSFCLSRLYRADRIVIGAAAGLILGQNIVATFFTNLSPDAHFALPWLQIAGFCCGLWLLAAHDDLRLPGRAI